MRPVLLPCLIVACSLFAASSAGAAAPVVAADGFSERRAAEAHARALRDHGVQASVQRDFTLGEGSAWSVRTSAVDAAAARRLADRLADVTGRPHAVYIDHEGVGTAEQARATPTPDLGPRIEQASEVRCVYVRELADGRRFRHHYIRLPGVEQVRVETEQGQLHVALRIEDEVAVQGGPDGSWGPVDRFRAVELVSSLRPDRVLQPAWAVPTTPDVHIVREGHAIDTSLPVPHLLEVRRGTERLDHVEIEVLVLDPPHVASPTGARLDAPSLQ